MISDLYISEGRFSVDPDKINMHPKIDRGQLITEGSEGGEFLRYKDTESGISPRPIAGLEGYVHVAPTDEHDEDSTLLSDEFTNPHKRRAMVEKRARKFDHILDDIAPPVLRGPAGADVTLVGWGSTDGIIAEAVDALNAEGISVNHLQIKWMVPFHGDNIMETLSKSKRTIIVENNFSGQFARYLRSETGFAADGHIRKYDGEPFMPHHIVDGVKAQIKGETTKYVPYQEITV